MATPDNPPPTSANPLADAEEAEGEQNPMTDPELRRELGEKITGRGLDR